MISQSKQTRETVWTVIQKIFLKKIAPNKALQKMWPVNLQLHLAVDSVVVLNDEGGEVEFVVERDNMARQSHIADETMTKGDCSLTSTSYFRGYVTIRSSTKFWSKARSTLFNTAYLMLLLRRAMKPVWVGLSASLITHFHCPVQREHISQFQTDTRIYTAISRYASVEKVNKWKPNMFNCIK